jgi:hypothetical protein
VRLGTLLHGCLLALGGHVSEQAEPVSVLASPAVVASTVLALTGLVLLGRRREWLPLLAIVSTLLVVSLLNDRVEPVVVRARHYAAVLPLGFVLVALAVVALHDWLVVVVPRRLAHGIGLLILASLLLAQQLALRDYVTDRLAAPDGNNRALLAVAEAISRGPRSERVYLDVQLAALRTMSGGRMYTQVRYLLLVRGQEFQAFDVARQELPLGSRDSASRRVVVSAGSLDAAAARYRLVRLPGDPGEGATIRVFRAYRRGVR